ncbi:MAG: hypothetical protein JWM12_3286, partial [Ilumatobacteraceae bacterium]|nr:hypothetical protein [Ilumatobacteraceae bacterium]
MRINPEPGTAPPDGSHRRTSGHAPSSLKRLAKPAAAVFIAATLLGSGYAAGASSQTPSKSDALAALAAAQAGIATAQQYISAQPDTPAPPTTAPPAP